MVIPNTIQSIGRNPFYGCVNLESIIVESDNSTFESPNGSNAIVEKITHTLVAGCKTTKIPEGILCIGYGAMGGQSGLTAIAIPESVTIISPEAFYRSGLTEVTIPASVDSIGRYAFGRCVEMDKVYSKLENPFAVDSLAFSYYDIESKKYYFSNATLSGTSGAVIAITLVANDLYQSGDVKLEKILLVTPDEKEIWAIFLPRYIL